MTKDTFDPYATGRILGAAQPAAAAGPVKTPKDTPKTAKAAKSPPSPKPTEPASSTDAEDRGSVNNIVAAQLRSIVERIERLAEEKQAIADDIKDVYGEAKANGLDTKVIRRIVALRKQDANERAEEAATLDLYMAALGMLSEPLFEEIDDPASRARRALSEADRKIHRRREQEDA